MTKSNTVMITVISLLVLSVAGSGYYVLSFGNPYNRYLANQRIPEALKERGYGPADITNAFYDEPKHLINKDYFHGHYGVVFADEPDLVYYYALKKDGTSIDQFCERSWVRGDIPEVDYNDPNIDSKHKEDRCVISLSNR